VNERPGGGCRTLDGNQAACVAAFQNGDPFTTREIPQALPCFYIHGKCLPCQPRAEGSQACRNSCFPPPVCADATRTLFAGGPGSDSCRSSTTQVDCEKTWHVGGIERPLSAATCYWTGTQCNGCGPRHRNAGDCTNSCAPGLTHPSCKDPARSHSPAGQNPMPATRTTATRRPARRHSMRAPTASRRRAGSRRARPTARDAGSATSSPATA